MTWDNVLQIIVLSGWLGIVTVFICTAVIAAFKKEDK